MPFLTRVLTTFVLGAVMTAPGAYAAEGSPAITVGTQEVGLTAGYMLPHRLTADHTTKQKGPAFMPSWMMTLTDPVGDGWYRGQVSIGAEVVYIQFNEPVLTHGIGFTPKIKYSFVALDQVRPYVEFAGGPFWTDLGGKIPEESSRFNFVLTAGFGLSWFITPQTSLNVGYRFHHISNAGTRYPNLGLNASLPFGGFSFYF
ncbi:MAG: acyloxyacyl hydrolase [Nitrospirota bacterium]|nr:acyloxyacyl hydrolase [Nitrospirota bacterium]MDP3598713.1 acyloxyacyl hydrolase [Nitrospirota bacterium]